MILQISAANFVELTIVIEGQVGAEAGRQCDMFFRRAEILIEPVTVEHAHLARQAFLDFGKGRQAAGLNFGDCFAYALAKATGEPLLFKGADNCPTYGPSFRHEARQSACVDCLPPAAYHFNQ
jgi:ribonuclease VapC